MNIETAFRRSKMVRAKYLKFLTKYLNPEQQTGILCREMKPPYITMCFLKPKDHFQRYYFFPI